MDNTRRSSSSRDAILDTAEALFGRYGPEGVSMRQIATDAGSANNSAVQYHFKSKEGLIDGIFDRRLSSLEVRRAEMLGNLADLTDLRKLLEALLLPIAYEKNSADKCSFAAFLLGLRMFGDISRWQDHSESAPVTVQINNLLRASLEDLPEQVFNARRLSAVSVFLVAVIDWDRRAENGSQELSPSREQYLAEVLNFAASGMMTELD